MNPIAELIADGPIVALHFRTDGGTSRSARAFIAELSATLTATGKKPLVYTTDHGLTAIYRFFQTADLRDERRRELSMADHRFYDIDDWTGRLNFSMQYDDAQRGNIELPDGGRWLDKRTPDSVARHELPVFDTEVVSQSVVALLGRWRDKLVNMMTPAQVVSKKSAVEIQYAPGIDISVDPSDWDPQRFINGPDYSLIEKVRRLRRKVLGGDSRDIIEGPQSRSLDE